MKIALVILHADPMRGGAERYTLDLAAALHERGHEITLLATTFADIPPGVRRIQLAAGGITRKQRYFRALDSLDEHVASGSFDLIHAMFPVRRCDLYHPHAGLAATGNNDLLNPRRRAMARIEQQLLATNPPRVVCLSQYLKQSVKKFYPLDDEHLPILFNAVDIERFNPAKRIAEKKADEIVALIIAQDFVRKGLHEAITALSKLPDQNLVLNVVGKQSTARYEKLAKQLGVKNHVRFLGPTRDTFTAYRNADFFVLPTKHDPCSLVVLEALAMGLPVISTRFNGACEIMTDGLHGFVLNDPADTDALADAMRKMLDPQSRQKMSAACLELRPKLSYEHHVNRLIEIYQQVGARD
jgi:UDP-glucose:(heptosyl)LPS alpha-1,3-glucosyltransferase